MKHQVQQGTESGIVSNQAQAELQRFPPNCTIATYAGIFAFLPDDAP